MPERDKEVGDPQQEDPRRRFRLTEKKIATITPIVSGLYGGAGYGVARLLSNKEIANRVGLGIGLGMSGALARMIF